MEKSVAEQMAESMVAAVKAHVAAALGPLRAEIAELRDELKAAQEVTSAQIEFNAKVMDRFATLPQPVNGKDGVDGKDGKSVDLEALGLQIEARVDAQVAKAIAEIPRAKDGTDGKDGIDGMPGIKGIDGRDGKDGADGRNGVDALDLLVADSIDVTKAQAVGTWARHAGGLWVARGQKPGIASWDCVAEGLSGLSFEMGDDERTLTIVAELSGGAQHKSTFTLPLMIQRGVWKSEAEYDRGDVTTRDGSSWHAERASIGAEPGVAASADDWLLIVKRGRDYDPMSPKHQPRVNNEPVRLR